MRILKEFRDFALRGNVVDLAVAVIIGGAFGAIVSSLVDNVITPLLLTPALKAANAQDLDKLTLWCSQIRTFPSCCYKIHHHCFYTFSDRQRI